MGFFGLELELVLLVELLKLLVVLLQLLVGFRYPILGLEVSLLDQFGPEVLLGGER